MHAAEVPLEERFYSNLYEAVADCPHILTSNALLVAYTLIPYCTRAWNEDEPPSINELAKRARISPRAVRYALEELILIQLIVRTERRGRTTRYDFRAWNGSTVAIPALGKASTHPIDPPTAGDSEAPSAPPPPPSEPPFAAPLHLVQGAAPGAVLHQVTGVTPAPGDRGGGGGAAPDEGGPPPTGAGVGWDPDPDPDPFITMDGSGSGSRATDAQLMAWAGAHDGADPLIDLRCWSLPDEWIGEWCAQGFRRDRLDSKWSRYRDWIGAEPKRLSYIRKGYRKWEQDERSPSERPPVPGENAQRSPDLAPSSSPHEKNGGLDVDPALRASCGEFGIDVGRVASEFVKAGGKSRYGAAARGELERQLRAALAAKQHAKRRASMTAAQLREDDERLARARAAAAGAAA